ncbi:hypothetical protein [Jeotgalibacillus sp. S-D1]|nr:hypothetical protein [Jeotgalibacillus sp. S-D1]
MSEEGSYEGIKGGNYPIPIKITKWEGKTREEKRHEKMLRSILNRRRI